MSTIVQSTRQSQSQARGTGASASASAGLAQQWEKTAALSETQLEDIRQLQDTVLIQSSSVSKGRDVGAARTQGPDTKKQPNESTVHISSNLSSFYHWYEAMLSDMEEDNERLYREHVMALSSYQALIADLSKQTNACMDSFARLLISHGIVREKTSSLDDACNQMLQDQERLVNLSDEVKNMLSYFDEHDAIFKQLADPQFSPEHAEYGPMLRRLDECIVYMSENSVFRDAKLYVVRFKQLQSKALAVVRDHIIQLIKASANATANQAGGSLTITSSQTRFRAIAPQLRRMLSFLESRASRRDISVLYTDCMSEYHTQRQRLLHASVFSVVAELVQQQPGKEDLTTPIIRRVIAHVISLCQMETQLFQEIFGTKSGQGGLNRSLQFRTIVVHLSSIDVLCEIILVLRSDIMGKDGELYRRGSSVAALHPIIRKMAEDAEERLIYRTETHVRDEIRGHVPSEDDLDYPSKLQVQPHTHTHSPPLHDSTSASAAKDGSSSSKTEAEAEGDDPELGKANRGNRRTWYPTVTSTLALMAKLYTTVDSEVFEGLAQELLLVCTASLLSASTMIAKSRSSLDATLFLVRHLLIVRDQISAFNVDFISVEKILDFSGVRTALSLFDISQVLTFSSRNAFVGLVQTGVPSVKQSVVDAKKSLEEELKNSCEDLILLVVRSGVLKDIVEFVASAKAFLSKGGGSDGAQQRNRPLHQEDWASPAAVKKLVESASTAIKNDLREAVTKVCVYVSVEEDVKLLLEPVKHNVKEALSRLNGLLKSHYTHEELGLGRGGGGSGGGSGGEGGGGGGGEGAVETDDMLDLDALSRDIDAVLMCGSTSTSV